MSITQQQASWIKLHMVISSLSKRSETLLYAEPSPEMVVLGRQPGVCLSRKGPYLCGSAFLS